MNTLDYFDNIEKKQRNDNLKQLIQIALADGKIDESEMKILSEIGRTKGFTEEEIMSFITSTVQNEFVPHYQLTERFQQMYEIMKVVLSNGNINNSEMRLATSLGIKLGFFENELPILLSLLINGIRNAKDEDALFKEFKESCLKKS